MIFVRIGTNVMSLNLFLSFTHWFIERCALLKEINEFLSVLRTFIVRFG